MNASRGFHVALSANVFSDNNDGEDDMVEIIKCVVILTIIIKNILIGFIMLLITLTNTIIIIISHVNAG